MRLSSTVFFGLMILPDVGCICNTGWTCLGDFSLDGYGHECLINYSAVRILSYLIIIIPSLCNILIIRHFVQLARRKRLSWEYKNRFQFYFLLMGISATLYGILKISYPDDQQPLVGRDVSISLVLAFVTCFCFIGIVYYLHVIIQFLKIQARMMTSASKGRIRKKLHFLGFISWFLIPSIVIISILPLIGIAYPVQSRELCKAYLIGYAVLGLVYGIITCNCLGLLINEIKGHISSITTKGSLVSKDLNQVVFRLNAAYYVVGVGCLVYDIICFIFAGSDLVFDTTTYFILIAFTMTSPLTFILVITVAHISQPDSNQIIPTDDSKKSTPGGSLKMVRSFSLFPIISRNSVKSNKSGPIISQISIKIPSEPNTPNKAQNIA